VRAGGGRYAEDYREDVLDIVRDIDLGLVDLEPRMLAHLDSISLFTHRLPWHFTPDGYRLTADALLEILGERVGSN